MKGIYSIGYVDNYGDFKKVWQNGETKKFATIEEAKEFIKTKLKNSEYVNNAKSIKIMQGWKTIEEV